jgi:hypothetical protein
MLVSDIVRRVRDAAGDLAVLQFSQATLTDWINDGVRECVIENSLLQARATTSTEIGTTEYILPSDIFKLHSVYSDGFKLEVKTLEEWEQANTGFHGADALESGNQLTCYVYAGILNLWPVPTAVVPITINYTKLPSDIVYTPSPESWAPSTPTIPAAFHNHIVAYCLAQVALQDDDINKYALLMGQFKSGVIDLKHIKDQEEDLYPFISISSRDAGDGTYG